MVSFLKDITTATEARSKLKVYSIDETDELLDNYYNKQEIDSLLGDYYNKTEVDRLFALAFAVVTGSTQTGSGGVIFDDFSTDSLAIKTNATYDPYGNYYTNESSGLTADETQTDYAIASTERGGFIAKNAFDNNDNTYWSPTRFGQSALNTDYIGQRFDNQKNIQKISMVQKNQPLSTYGAAIPIANLNVEYSDDGLTWKKAIFWEGLPWNAVITTSPRFSAGSHQYWRLLAGQWHALSYWGVTEIEMKSPLPLSAKNMTLESKPQTLLAANPKSATVYVLVEEIDALDCANDWALEVGLTNASGTMFEDGVFKGAQDFGAGKMVRYDIDLSGKSGTALKWFLRTKNNKAQQIEQVAVMPFY